MMPTNGYFEPMEGDEGYIKEREFYKSNEHPDFKNGEIVEVDFRWIPYSERLGILEGVIVGRLKAGPGHCEWMVDFGEVLMEGDDTVYGYQCLLISKNIICKPVEIS